MRQGQLTVTYIGGPTALFEWDGVRLLTDPTFDPPGGEYRTGPVVLKKTGGPALGPESIGQVDIVLLSHDHHYDDLDHAGRKFLANVPHVLTTMEGAERLGGHAVGLSPWQSMGVAGADGRVLQVTGTPAQHGPAHLQRGAVTGFVAAFVDAADYAFYFSGDTVWFDGVVEVARRFLVRIAALNMGAARVPAVGPFALTMTAEDGIRAARAFSEATIVPLHYEGWEHFSESREVISRAFDAAGINGGCAGWNLEFRLPWLNAGGRSIRNRVCPSGIPECV